MDTKKFLAVSAIAVVILLPAVVSAQLPTVTPPSVPGLTLTEIENLIRRVAQFFMVIGVILAVAYIIWGGITRMHAQGDEGKIKTANQRIQSGVIGALVVLAVGLIIQTLAGLVARTFFQ